MSTRRIVVRNRPEPSRWRRRRTCTPQSRAAINAQDPSLAPCTSTRPSAPANLHRGRDARSYVLTAREPAPNREPLGARRPNEEGDDPVVVCEAAGDTDPRSPASVSGLDCDLHADELTGQARTQNPVHTHRLADTRDLRGAAEWPHPRDPDRRARRDVGRDDERRRDRPREDADGRAGGHKAGRAIGGSECRRGFHNGRGYDPGAREDPGLAGFKSAVWMVSPET